MREPLPVTDEDVRAFWMAFYSAQIGTTEYPALPPKDDDHSQHLLQQFRKGIENDRRRVIERQEQPV